MQLKKITRNIGHNGKTNKQGVWSKCVKYGHNSFMDKS